MEGDDDRHLPNLGACLGPNVVIIQRVKRAPESWQMYQCWHMGGALWTARTERNKSPPVKL